LIKLIIKHTQLFVVDQYGNYVVQYVIMLKDFNANKLIADEFLKMNIIAISKQKFSSNVVEKVLKVYYKLSVLIIVMMKQEQI